MYDIVIVADQGVKEAWTVTTVVIGEIVSILILNHPCLYSTFIGPILACSKPSVTCQVICT